MTMVSAPAAPLRSAREAVAGALQRAGVSILELASAADTERASELLSEVWRSAERPVPANLLRAVQQSGGYAFGAYDGTGALVAACMGLLAQEGLHSHITGVAPGGQRRGLGLALKQHQRLWALERGLGCITWTCDPLTRRNVTFNLHALGASVVAYLPNHYGAMTDGLNKGDDSDRFSLAWELAGPRAEQASLGRLAHLAPEGYDVLVAADDEGWPVAADPMPTRGLVQLPADIEAIRRVDGARARAWRLAVRDAVLPALTAGGSIAGLTESGALVLEGTS